MLPVIMATAQHQTLLGPDDLTADLEPGHAKAFGHGGGVQRPVPDIGHLTGKERPGLAPIRAVVIGNLASAFRLCGANLVAPARIIHHAIRRIRNHEMRCDPIQKPGNIRR